MLAALKFIHFIPSPFSGQSWTSLSIHRTCLHRGFVLSTFGSRALCMLFSYRFGRRECDCINKGKMYATIDQNIIT